MPAFTKQRGAKFQLRVIHKLLPKPFYFTFETREEADSYGVKLEAMLARGVVPVDLLADEPKTDADPTLTELVGDYRRDAPVTDSDDELLGQMLPELVGVRFSGLSMMFAEQYVRRLKTGRNIAPGTIRKRVGAIARVLDWHIARTPRAAGTLPPANAFRLLPRGYSNYSRIEVEALPEGKVAKRDVSRDRRLAPGEFERILAAIGGEKRPDRERPLPADPAFGLLFVLIVETGLRLREAYRLRVDQIDLKARLIRVEGSKGHRGVLKPRTVPIDTAMAQRLAAWCKGRVGLVFPYWDGSPDDLTKATARLGHRFRTAFAYAGVEDLTEHDLRHEATCRWVLRRAPGGGWSFSDIEICKIMGWTKADMMLRYASLRGEDLSSRMA